MYSPYGSYSSMSSASQPMEIPTSSYLSYNYNGSYSSRCAFPSWPQRSSLTDEHEQRATSYLSDDDLFPCDDSDDAHSVSSAGSTTPTSPVATTEADMARLRQEQMAMQREAIKFLLSEKERRKQAASKKQRRSSSGSKKSSPKTKQAHLDAIAEAGE